MRVVTLKQGSPEWHAWRSNGIGASEAAAVVGQSPWDTQLTLWQRKTGRRPPKPTMPWMLRGIELEPEARAAYEKFTGETVAPVCVEHEVHRFVRASLDGATIGAEIVTEIKVPGEKDHAIALAGTLPRKYEIQVQHQLLCVPEAKIAHYWSYDPATGGVLVVVQRDPAFQKILLEAHCKFWDMVVSDQEPTESKWLMAAHRWLRAHYWLKEVEAAEKEARAGLVELVPEGVKYHEGGGVCLTSSPRVGNVNWKGVMEEFKIPEDAPERYRGKSTTTVRVYPSGDEDSAESTDNGQPQVVPQAANIGGEVVTVH